MSRTTVDFDRNTETISVELMDSCRSADVLHLLRETLKTLPPGDRLEVLCTDPLAVIDIPNLIRETGDKVEITERSESRIVFLIEKADAAA